MIFGKVTNIKLDLNKLFISSQNHTCTIQVLDSGIETKLVADDCESLIGKTILSIDRVSRIINQKTKSIQIHCVDCVYKVYAEANVKLGDSFDIQVYYQMNYDEDEYSDLDECYEI